LREERRAEIRGLRGGSRRGPARRSAVLLTGLAVILVACGGEDVRDSTGRVVAPGPWTVFDLRPGDCITQDEDLKGDVDEVTLVPCDLPHTQEVVGTVQHPDDAYPGAGSLATFADARCLSLLEGDLDLTIDDGIAFSYLLPTFEGWNKHGDKNVICVLVFPEDIAMTGSFVAGTAELDQLTRIGG
jgi:hypothetical protein